MNGLVEDLPWASMSPKALEELTFAILEEMGAIALEWRSSDESINAPDAGRDLEAVFNQPTPDGDFDRQRWWFECKRRSKAVAPSDVKEGILNAVTYTDISYYIIVTNSHFSNPTRDWVARHNDRRVGPTVKLWDRRRLQSLVSKYPSAAARSLVAALSFPERLEFLAAYFFEHGRTINEVELRFAWARREEIDNVEFCVAASYADICSGNIVNRPWMACLSDEHLGVALLTSYTVLLGVLLRDQPIINEKVVETQGYITGCAAVRLPTSRVAEMLDSPSSFFEEDPVDMDEDTRELVVGPGKRALLSAILSRCADDCARYSMDLREENRAKAFWRSYISVPTERDPRQLVLIDTSIPCAVGLEVTKDIQCPLDSDFYYESTGRYVDMIKRVIKFRIENPGGQYLLYSPDRPTSIGADIPPFDSAVDGSDEPSK